MTDKDLTRISAADSSAGPDRKLLIWMLEPEQNWNEKGKAIDHVGPAERACEMHPRTVLPGGTEPCSGQGAALALTGLHMGEHWGAPGVQAEASQVNSESLSQWLAGRSHTELSKVYAMTIAYRDWRKGWSHDFEMVPRAV